jgi:VCBS repeat-containing protein
MRTLRNLFGRKQLDNRLRSQTGSRLQFKPGIEPLEERQLLSVSSLLDAGPAESTIRNAGETVDLSLTVDAAASSVRVSFVIESTDGSLDPGIPSFINDATGNPIDPTSIQSAVADANGGTGSVVVLDLAPGTYTVVAHGDGATIGGFTADVFLPGDLDGDNAISYMDRLYAEAAAMQASGYPWNIDTAQIFAKEGIDLNVPQYLPQMDANGDGLMTDFDLFAVQANQGVGEINVELIADQDPPTVVVQRANGQDWSEQNGSLFTPTPELKVTVTDESVITGFQVGYAGAFIDYFAQVGANGDNFQLDVAALEALGLPKVNDTIADGTYTLQFTGIDEHNNKYTEEEPFEFTFTLLADNDAPDALDDGADTDQSTPIEAGDDVNVLDNDSDPDAVNGDTIQVTDVMNFNPTWGSVDITPDGVLTFSPRLDTFEHLGDTESEEIVFQYEISDGLGLTDTANVTITVNGVNDSPEATNPTITPAANVSAESAGIPLNDLILDNFTDPDANDVLTIQSVIPLNGHVVESGGNWTYIPNNDFDPLVEGATALDSFTVTVQDPLGLTAQATLSVVIEGENDGPTAGLDEIMDGNGTIRVNEDDGPIDLTAILLNNDSDPDTDGGRESLPADTLTIVSKTDPGEGVVALNNGVLTFDPNGDFENLAVGEFRTTTFTYTVADRAAGGLESSATVTVTVYGENDAPTAINDGIAPQIPTDEDTPITLSDLTANDTDLDDTDVLTIISTDQLSVNGAAITLNLDGTVTYDPTGSTTIQALTEGTPLSDSFTYTIEDGSNVQSTATVTITLTGVNDPVTIDPGQEFSIAAVADDAGPISIGTVAKSDDDVGDSYIFTITNKALSPGAPTVNLDNIVIDQGSGEISVAVAETLPNTGQEYSITADVSVVENGVAGAVTDTKQIVIRVVPNQPPVVTDITDVFVTEDDQAAIVVPAQLQLDQATDVDNDDNLLVLNYTPGVWTVIPNQGQYQYDADGAIIFDPLDDFDDLPAGQNEQVTVPFAVEDPAGNVTGATVTITVTGVNDEPIAVDDVFSIDEDATDTFNIFDSANDDNDPDGPLTLQNSTFTTDEGVAITIDANGDFTYDASGTQFQKLGEGDFIEDMFTYTLEDPVAPNGTSEATVTIIVTGVNDPVTIPDQEEGVPAATDDSISGPKVIYQVEKNDLDNGDVYDFTITNKSLSAGAPAVDLNNIVIDSATGEISVSTQDTLINSGQEYTITLDVSIAENGGPVADTAVITINVIPNEPPIVTDITDETTGENANLTVTAQKQLAQATDNDDPDQDLVLKYTPGVWNVIPTQGRYMYDTDGAILFEPLTDFDDLAAGQDEQVTIPFAVEDPAGNVTGATVTITVTGVNDGPEAVDDTFGINEDESKTFNIFTESGVDIDPDSPLTLQDSTLTTSEGVNITIGANGDFVYDATGSQFQSLGEGDQLQNPDTFTYTLQDPDDANATSTATVTITVTGVNDQVSVDSGQTFDVEGVADDSIGSPLPLGSVATSDTDAGDVYKYSITGGSLSSGAPAVDLNNIVIDEDTGEITIVAQDTLINSTEEYTITLNVSVVEDGLASPGTGTIDIVVAPNQPPTVADYSTSVSEGSQVEITANDLIDSRPNDVSDPDGDTISLKYTEGQSLTPLTGGGIYSIDSSGTITYQPNGDYNGLPFGGQALDAVTIPFEVQDVHGNVTQATVTITVNGVNDPPTAVNDGPFAVDANASLTTENVLTNDTDPDTGETALLEVLVPFGQTSTTVTSEQGIQVTINNDGTFTYDPGDEFEGLDETQHATDKFTYQAIDPQTVLSNEATVTITINGVNDGPQLIGPIPDQSVAIGPLPTAGAAIIDLTQYVEDPEGDPIPYTVSFDDATPADDFFTISIIGDTISINSNGYAAVQDWTPVEVTVNVTGLASPLTFNVTPDPDFSAGFYLVATATSSGDGTVSLLPDSEAVSGSYNLELWYRDWLSTAEYGTDHSSLSYGLDLTWTGDATFATTAATFESGVYFIDPDNFGFPMILDHRAQVGGAFKPTNVTGRDAYQRLATFHIDSSTNAVFQIEQPSEATLVNKQLVRTGQALTSATQIIAAGQRLSETGSSSLSGVHINDENIPAGAYLAVTGPQAQPILSESASEKPNSVGTLSEWDAHWVEVWVAASEADSLDLAAVDLSYSTEYFTATDIQFGSSFISDGEVLINDAEGTVLNISGRTTDGSITGDGLVLLARVKFESIDQDNVPFALAEDALDLGVKLTSVQLGSSIEGTLFDAHLGAAPRTELWANPFDSNDDQVVEMLDLLTFIDTYGANIENLGGEAWATDYNRSGDVEILDLLSFIDNYGLNRANGDRIILPEDFMRNWSGSAPDMVGETSLSELFDTAVNTWSDSMGPDHQIDVDLVVRDLPEGQLGAAKILEFDEQGLPSRSIVTIDQDAAGYGWYSGTDGETPEDKYDLYTSLVHELGHAYGFTQTFSGFASLTVENPEGDLQFEFDAITIPLDADGEHVAAPESILSAELSPGESKRLTWTETLAVMSSYAFADPDATIHDTSSSLWGTSVRSIESPGEAATHALTLMPTETGSSSVTDFTPTLSLGLSLHTGADSEMEELTDAQREELYRNGIAVHRTVDHDENLQINTHRARMLAWQSWSDDDVEDDDAFETEEDETLDTDALMADWAEEA